MCFALVANQPDSSGQPEPTPRKHRGLKPANAGIALKVGSGLFLRSYSNSTRSGDPYLRFIEPPGSPPEAQETCRVVPFQRVLNR